MRVLIIEPNATTARGIEHMIRLRGFVPYQTDVGEEGISLARLYDYDAITLELNLPDMSGMEVIRTMRRLKVNTPIIVLSNIADIADKVAALMGGADDYMTKPYHKDELVARLLAVIRRAKGHASSTITCGDFVLLIDERQAQYRGKPVRLTEKQYGVFELLMLRAGSVVSKEAIMNHLYGGRDEPELKIMDVFICKLRERMQIAMRRAGIDRKPPIETVWGRGWRMIDDGGKVAAARATAGVTADEMRGAI